MEAGVRQRLSNRTCRFAGLSCEKNGSDGTRTRDLRRDRPLTAEGAGRRPRDGEAVIAHGKRDCGLLGRVFMRRPFRQGGGHPGVNRASARAIRRLVTGPRRRHDSGRVFVAVGCARFGPERPGRRTEGGTDGNDRRRNGRVQGLRGGPLGGLRPRQAAGREGAGRNRRGTYPTSWVAPSTSTSSAST